jgi:DNA polymerase-3 subunit delta
MTTAGSGVLRLVVGDEELLVARAVAAAVAATRAEDADAVVTEHAAAEMTSGELLAAVSPSLFGGRRVVVVRDAQDARKELAAALIEYAAAPDPEVVLVVTHAGGAKGKALLESLRDAGGEVSNAARITRHRERLDFVRDEFRRLGSRCTDDTAEALLAAVGNDLRDLSAACGQLIADTGGKVDVQTVARYYRGRAEVSGFTVADAAVVGDLAGALEALRWALHVGVDPVPIADALADGVRTVARVAGAGRGSVNQIAGTLGLPPWKVERAQRQARGWTPEGLVRAMQVAAKCNAEVKGGSDDRGYALESAVFAVAAARTVGSR